MFPLDGGGRGRGSHAIGGNDSCQSLLVVVVDRLDVLDQHIEFVQEFDVDGVVVVADTAVASPVLPSEDELTPLQKLDGLSSQSSPLAGAATITAVASAAVAAGVSSSSPRWYPSSSSSSIALNPISGSSSSSSSVSSSSSSCASFSSFSVVVVSRSSLATGTATIAGVWGVDVSV